MLFGLRIKTSPFSDSHFVKSLSIQVTDINDVQPQFTKDTFQFLTYENKDKDFPIGFVNATDPDNTAAATKNTAYQGRAEMKQLLYQTNTSVAMSRNAEEMVKRNIYSERSKSECYAEGQLQNKYESSVQSRTLPKPTPKYCQPVVVTSSDDAVEDNATMVCNYTSDTMSSKRSGRQGELKHYEEIPGVSDFMFSILRHF
ncbi:protocadherin beta-2-like isoform X1 [Octopus vulgaris]|uniref:Protocadherin beta-2-like isoform X1 n=1 Tax=Octopus vulgaris TaxID=6645 RepID=A0AA36BFN9_OCTVU|nr:protocadherin beta-2-like isoform X1 [Octopus vulgaris]